MTTQSQAQQYATERWGHLGIATSFFWRKQIGYLFNPWPMQVDYADYELAVVGSGWTWKAALERAKK